MFKVNGRWEEKNLKHGNYFSESWYVNYKEKMKNETFKSNEKGVFSKLYDHFYFQMRLNNHKTKLKEM